MIGDIALKATVNVSTALVVWACVGAWMLRAEEPGTNPAGENNVSTIQSRVDTLLASKDPVMIRRGIEDVFSLVDRLIEEGKTEAAMPYLEAALRRNSWALPYQLLYAELLDEKGDRELAGRKAKLVRRYTERDDLYERAGRLLGKPSLETIAAMDAFENEGTTLVLVPVGEVDMCVLQDLRAELASALAIPVLLRNAEVSIPKYKRDALSKYLNGLRKWIVTRMEEDTKFAAFLKARGWDETALQKDGVVIEASRQLAVQSSGAGAGAKFNQAVRKLKEVPKQWDISDLLAAVRKAVRPYRHPRVYFMGVANRDAYSGQSNFIFGTAETGGRHAVITCKRFSAAFNGETPNRSRLVERTLKQALSSFGFMLGVPRCSSPVCARAYPHNLAEHDAKSRKLCPECRKGFENALGTTISEA